MNFVLTRTQKKSKTMDGYLTIEGEYICDTTENAAGCLPPGRYPIHIVKCDQEGRKMPLLSACTCNCADCSMLKSGNGVYRRTNGSILVGTLICPGCVKHSQKAFKALYQRLRKSAERGNELQLIIQ